MSVVALLRFQILPPAVDRASDPFIDADRPTLRSSARSNLPLTSPGRERSQHLGCGVGAAQIEAYQRLLTITGRPAAIVVLQIQQPGNAAPRCARYALALKERGARINV